MSERGEITRKGPSIGFYLDRDIPAWIDARGKHYVYARIWDDKDARVEQLNGDEIVIAPGLIYSANQPEQP